MDKILNIKKTYTLVMNFDEWEQFLSILETLDDNDTFKVEYFSKGWETTHG